jgi:uncharacterized protein (TIGR03437 family)
VSARVVFLAVVFTSSLPAQFTGISSTSDGSSLYFTTTLRLKGSSEPRNGKVFVAAQDAVTLFRAREPAFAPADSPACTVGGFADYLAAETSAGGVVALSYQAHGAAATCSYPPFGLMTHLVTATGETDLPGIVRLSAAGRYAIVFNQTSSRQPSPFTLAYLDLQTGAQTPVPSIALTFPESVLLPFSRGRVIANDGTTLLGINRAGTHYRGYLLKPGVDPQPFPIADGLPLIIDAAASKVLYQTQSSFYLLDLRTLQSTLLGTADQLVFYLAMSDDARLLLFLGNGQVHVLDTATLLDRTLTSDPAYVTEAAISGDGKFVHAVTGNGRILKINVDDGSQIELIGHTPYLDVFPGPVIPGLTLTLTGSGLSDSVVNGTVPLNAWLGNVTMWIGERKVPVVQLAPKSVSIIVPWDIQSDGGFIRIQAEAPGEHTPFYFPEVIPTLSAIQVPTAGAIARQDWTRTFVGPINTGEVIHVFAIGFGPVSPEVPQGAAAPAAEPYSRLTKSLTCSNSEILYAGLAPYAVERVYQIDMRIGPTAGYQKFTCSLGGAAPFLFLTLNIVQ